MKGFSIPNVSIPKISIPNISVGSGGIDTNTIKSAITSALPDLSNLASNLDIENKASEMFSDAMGDGIELPAELKNLLK